MWEYEQPEIFFAWVYKEDIKERWFVVARIQCNWDNAIWKWFDGLELNEGFGYWIFDYLLSVSYMLKMASYMEID